MLILKITASLKRVTGYCRAVRYRGNGTLEGFRCDSATVTDGENTVKLKKPILAVSKTRLKDDYRAIVNPNIFL